MAATDVRRLATSADLPPLDALPAAVERPMRVTNARDAAAGMDRLAAADRQGGTPRPARHRRARPDDSAPGDPPGLAHRAERPERPRSRPRASERSELTPRVDKDGLARTARPGAAAGVPRYGWPTSAPGIRRANELDRGGVGASRSSATRGHPRARACSEPRARRRSVAHCSADPRRPLPVAGDLGRHRSPHDW